MSAGHGHDNWHQHTAAEGVAQHAHGAQASAKALGITFLVMVFGVIATILVLIAYFNTAFSSYQASQTEAASHRSCLAEPHRFASSGRSSCSK